MNAKITEITEKVVAKEKEHQQTMELFYKESQEQQR